MNGDATNQIELDADPADLPRLLEWVRSRLEELDAEGRPAMVVELAAEELGLNAMTHGRPEGRASRVSVTLEGDERWLRLTIEDEGRAFDPTTIAAPDTDAGIEDRAIGGLGVHLVRRMADDMRYERRDLRNRIEVVVSRTASGAS